MRIIGSIIFVVGAVGYCFAGPIVGEGVSAWFIPTFLGLGIVIGSFANE